jgi:hypothetical protein
MDKEKYGEKYKMIIRFTLNKDEINTFNKRNIEIREIIEDISLDTITMEIDINNRLPLEEMKYKPEKEALSWIICMRIRG